MTPYERYVVLLQCDDCNEKIYSIELYRNEKGYKMHEVVEAFYITDNVYDAKNMAMDLVVKHNAMLIDNS